ncbi:hypothetical protein AF72_07960 [Xylella taiwanensis]|uniref:Uncharacterized protein n=1 Tax=Xylella taiwanensis TaxID=1444770 RepID=Z9JK04_9GAMM|nr:hypothetical protein AF72_07960 [Xylella taiwanensis]
MLSAASVFNLILHNIFSTQARTFFLMTEIIQVMTRELQEII